MLPRQTLPRPLTPALKEAVVDKRLTRIGEEVSCKAGVAFYRNTQRHPQHPHHLEGRADASITRSSSIF